MHWNWNMHSHCDLSALLSRAGWCEWQWIEQCTDMKRVWEINSDSRSAVRVAGQPTTAGRAATKGWVLYMASTHVRKQKGRGRHRDNMTAGENS